MPAPPSPFETRAADAAALLGAAAAVATIGWADGVTGQDVGLSALYLAPVIALGWRGRWIGAAGALLATGAWVLSDLVFWRAHSSLGLALNGGFRGASFLLLALAAARIRRDRVRERALNAQLTVLLNHADRLATTGALAAGIAHELGTPLSVIGGRAKLVAGTPGVSPEVAENARIISEQAAKVTATVRQLMDFTRRRGGPRSRHDLRAITRRAVAAVEPTAQRTGVCITANQGEAPVEADVDPTQLEQVITNLLVNAVQAMPQGGPVQVEVAVRAEASPRDGVPRSFPSIAIQDAGPGILAEDLPHLFEPFFTTKPAGEGTGLGLAVAQGIVAEHGGWISVESTAGQGARFTVFLPAA